MGQRGTDYIRWHPILICVIKSERGRERAYLVVFFYTAFPLATSIELKARIASCHAPARRF